MQYKGFKRIRSIAAVILAVALLVSEMPQTGTVYAAQENRQEEQVTPREEQSSTPDSGSGTTGTEADGTEPETMTDGGIGQTETESSTETNTDGKTEEPPETEPGKSGGTKPKTGEKTKIYVPTVDTRVYEPAPEDIEIDEVSLAEQGVEGAVPVLDEEKGVYVLKNKDDFLDFIESKADYKDKTVRLECDIDMDGATVGYDGMFSGIFDGKGHSIVDFKTSAGLFRYIESGAVVKNLHISSASLGGIGSAGVIASTNDGTIQNCTVRGSLTVQSGMGVSAGIAAVNGGTIKDCVFSGDISAADGANIGGISGRNQGTIEGCGTAGMIDTAASVVAGISAVNEGSVKKSYNYMNVTGILSVAGIVAENAGYVNECINYGNVRLTKTDNAAQAGGICAKSTNLIKKSQNYGNVSGACNNVGGIAGCTSGQIEECGNYGEIKGLSNAAGIVGLYRGTELKSITRSYNKGAVHGNGLGIGGILGSADTNNPVNVENCYNLGSVSNSADSNECYSGGIAGVLKNGSISSCYNVGDLPSGAKLSGSIAGFLSRDESFKKSYFKEDSLNCIYYKETGAVLSEGSEFKMTETNLKSADMIEKLGDAYEAKSGVYPVLRDQVPEKHMYLVVYELNGGCSDRYFELVSKNEKVTRPDDPSKTYGTFGGWYSDSALGNEFSFDSVVGSKVVVIYAKWNGTVPVVSFDFRNKSASVPRGKTYEIVVDYKPKDAGNKALRWESADISIATVSAAGIVTAVNVGSTVIKAALDDGSRNIVREFNVKVTDKSNEIWIRDANGEDTDENPNYGKDIETLDVTINEPYAVEAVVSGDVPDSATIVWASSNESVAVIEADGTAAKGRIARIKGKKKGRTVITARFRESSASNTVTDEAILEVNVRPLSDGVAIMLGGETVTNSTLVYDYGTSKFVAAGSGEGNRLLTPVPDLSAKVYPSVAEQKVEWTSSDTSVIEFVDKYSGRLKAKTNGKAKVTVTAVDTKKTAEVTVEVKKVAEALAIEPVGIKESMPVIIDKNGRVALTSGQSIKLKPIYTPSDTTDKGVRWKYSGNGKAIKIEKIESGAAAGEWRVTAQDVTRETEVTVTAVTLDLGPTGDGATGMIRFIIKPKVAQINIYREEDSRNPVNGKNIGLNPEIDRNTFGLRVRNEPENSSQIVTWKSSDENIATIQDNGDGSCVVTVKSKMGKATITAKAADGSGITAETTVNVTVTVTGITITGSKTVRKGKTVQLTAKVEPASVANSKVTWESLNPSVAKVDGATGKVTGIGAGITTIIAKSADGGGAKENHSIVVTESIKELRIIDGQPSKPIDPINAAALNNKSIGIDPDGDKNEWKLGVYVAPMEACQTVEWKSSNTKVAAVDKDGTVTAKSFGSSTITATSTDGSGKSASLTVNVATLTKGITITGPHYVGIGKTIQLKAEISNKDATNSKVLWSSSNPGAIKVDKDGKVSVVKGKEAGYADIKAEAADGSGVSSLHTVYIMGAEDTVEIVSSDETYKIKSEKKERYIDIDMQNSEYVTVSLEAKLEGGTRYDVPKDVLWSSSDKKIAKVVKTDGTKATLEVYSEGKAIITAKTADGYAKSNDTCTIRVKNSQPVVKITGPAQVAVDKTVKLSTGRTEIEKWSSSNTKIAIVNSKGEVTGKKKGTVTITATAKVGSNKDTYEVEVQSSVKKVDILLDDVSATVVTGKKLGVDISGNGLWLLAAIDGKTGDEDTNGNEPPVGVVWKSDKTAVAKVDENGKVEPMKAGTAVITATATDGSGKRASVTVIVTKQVKEIFALNATLSADGKAYETRVAKGKSVKLKVGYKPFAATTKKVTWKVAPGDEKYVSINKNDGTINAVRAVDDNGYATVTATAADKGGAVCTFRIYVTNPAVKVVVTQENVSAGGDLVQRGGTLREYPANSTIGIDIDGKNKVELGALVTDKDGRVLDGQAVTWKSGNTKIASVDSEGVVTGHKIGKTTMMVSVLDGSNKSCRINIYVGRLVTRIESDNDVVELRKGKTVDLRKLIVVRPVTATNQKLKFKSKDTKVAAVDSKGVVKGQKKGETQIIVSTTDGTNIEKIITIKVN